MIRTTVLLMTLIVLTTSHSFAGIGAGNGGDSCEDQIQKIRKNMEFWLTNGGPEKGLELPAGISLQTYEKQMLKYISLTRKDQSGQEVPNPLAAHVSCTSDKIFVNGDQKTCRNYEQDPVTGFPSITCNFDEFNGTIEDRQFFLMHHEFAGLAGFEVNNGPESQYTISDQITGFLRTETVRRLAIVAPEARSPIYFAPRDANAADCLYWYRKHAENFGVGTVVGTVLLGGLSTPVTASRYHHFKNLAKLLSEAEAGDGRELTKFYTKEIYPRDPSITLQRTATILTIGNRQRLYCQNDVSALWTEKDLTSDVLTKAHEVLPEERPPFNFSPTTTLHFEVCTTLTMDSLGAPQVRKKIADALCAQQSLGMVSQTFEVKHDSPGCRIPKLDENNHITSFSEEQITPDYNGDGTTFDSFSSISCVVGE